MAFYRPHNAGCRRPWRERCPKCGASLIGIGASDCITLYRCGGRLHGDEWLRQCHSYSGWAGTPEGDAAEVAAMRQAIAEIGRRIQAARAVA